MSLAQFITNDRLKVASQTRCELIDITAQVQKAVSQSEMANGWVVVFCPHTTAGVTINENADPDVKHDLLRKLEALVPKHEAYYRHAEGNSDSHLKTAMVGSSTIVFVDNKRLTLGRWQGIYLCEFDGPRTRDVWVRMMGTRPMD
jgi:secondary thiamine-phosphate synthase enzyme